eukprot:Plantae.Rhodophyta-Purpureofilum_apyrenoidigerum.ctg18109.p1 GENE.Plantae.Rhodophyta-Purpureofilum_apyrenoidigerum.ctg18109~~Plantae.Rhodophyta-Purpureofilum_apyrenoidigerum.ctg18109.p1  ORF type:complete len:227 (-),score=40.82 Plantae.Rhodophyta-Purpureofilum_apyrenoidigerum.ctg18109:21-701(-)
MRAHSCRTFNVYSLYEEMLKAAARGGAVDLAINLWTRMRRDFADFQPSIDAYCNTINVYGKAGYYDEAFDMLSKSREERVQTSVEYVFAAAMALFTPRTKAHLPSPRFSAAPLTLRDLAQFVNAMAQSAEEVDRAYYKLVERRDEAKQIDVMDLNLILAACARLGDSVRTRQTFDEIEGTFGLKPNVVSYNMLFQMAEYTGEISSVSSLILVSVLRHGVQDNCGLH